MEENKNTFSTEETENSIDTPKTQDSLDALLFDDEAEVESSQSDDDASFESFMAEYRSLINTTLSSTENTEKEDVRVKEEIKKTPQISKNQKKNPKKKAVAENTAEEKMQGEWNENITLAPEEYDDPYEDDKILLENPETEVAPDFNLGATEEESENSFQLSINFDGNRKDTPTSEEDSKKASKYDPEKPRFMDWVYDIAEIFVFVLATVLLLTAFVFKHSVVEGSSMSNTLSDGDHLIISDLFYTPKRGDVIVFEDYSTILKKAVVKRVIGLPGETVQVKVDEDGNVVVYINGELLVEEYAYNAKDCDISKYYEPVTLGEDEIFVMGDNRYHSTDSRSNGVGPVKIDTILGKVLFRFFPFDSFGGIE